MMWSKIIMGGIAGITLSACGGGGNGSPISQAPVTPPVTPTPTEFNRMPSTLGDFYTQKQVQIIKYADGKEDPSYTGYSTEFVSEQNSTSYSTITTNDAPAGAQRGRTYEASGKLSLSSSANTCPITFVPAVALGLPITVRLDTSWDINYVSNQRCTVSQTSDQISVTGKVLGQETVTTAAGTFSAIKYSSKRTVIRPTKTLVSEATCWAEPSFGIDLKCEITEVQTDLATPQNNLVATVSTELVAYSHAASRQKKLGTERFAGGWKGIYTGNDQGGVCYFDVTLTGQLKGSCGAQTVAGAIDANGNLSFVLSANGISTSTFKGTSESPGTMGGSWLLPNGGGGTWTMTHK